MKKLFSILIAVMLVLCACGQGSGDGNAVIGSKKKWSFTSTGEKAESSIFGRNVKYDAFTPADDLALPIPSDEILDMVQIEKALYFLTDGAVHSLNIESGESKKLFDTDAEMFATHGGKLYTYSAETAKLSEYDASGSVTNTLTLEVSDVDSVLGIAITDDYYVFKCEIVGKMYIETYAFIYSRETEELTVSNKMPLWGIDLYPYKGNKLLSVTEDSTFGAPYLGIFDAETGKNEKLRWLNTEYWPAIAYCPKTDTALVFGVPPKMTYNYSSVPMLEGNTPCCIYEYSLDDEDEIVRNRYYFDTSYDTKLFVNIYENIVFAVSSADNECRIYDYLNPPESITILGSLYDQNVIFGFEKETGILLKTANTDYDKLALKLMAGDDDFDIFNPVSNFHNYVDAGACVDLKEIESLNSRISGNAAADLVASYDGKYFAVPVRFDNYSAEEYYPEDGSNRSYSLMVSEHNYYARNVDVGEGRYSDPNGDELYKLLKFLHDNPTGNRKKMPFGDDIMILYAHMYMLNPKSQNRDSAIRFLEYLFDCYNGDIPGIVPENQLNPRLESTENCYASWRCEDASINIPVFEARNAVLSPDADFSNSELKKLARETAAKVRMRMME